jgi:hypothetical protein
MLKFWQYRDNMRRALPFLIGLAFLAGAPSRAAAVNTAAAVCGFGTNTCNVNGACDINSDTPIDDGAILDFRALCNVVQVNSGGVLRLAGKAVSAGQCAAGDQSSKMIIQAADLIVKTGGLISGDNTLAEQAGGKRDRNGGAIFIELTEQAAGTTGSLIVQPGGEISSDSKNPSAKGRGGVITVVADGQILVQESQGVRGRISTDSDLDSRQAWQDGCGRAQITLVATSTNSPDAVVIDGDVQQLHAFGSGTEAVIGGRIYILGGGSAANLQHGTVADPPFPSPGQITRNNPPNDSARVVVNQTGIVINTCKDDGGCEIHVYSCFALVEGLVESGGFDPQSGAPISREQKLPVFIEFIQNEDIVVQNGGRIIAEIREGYQRHKGQYDNTNPASPLCEFIEQIPAGNNGPLTNTRGAGDICLTARRLIHIDGSVLPAGQFAVNARIGGTFNTQTGGNVNLLQTATEDEGGLGIELVPGNDITVTAVLAGSKGGRVRSQANVGIDINGIVLARGNSTGSVGGSGGVISMQSVNAQVLGTVGGQLDAGANSPQNGAVNLISCVNVAGFPPATSNPAPTITNADCNSPDLVIPPALISLLPCGQGCFCLERFSLKQGVLSIFGQGLKGVSKLEVNASSCNPGTGTTLVINSPKTDTKITANFAGTLTSGKFIVLSNPAGPSSSCLPQP